MSRLRFRVLLSCLYIAGAGSSLFSLLRISATKTSSIAIIAAWTSVNVFTNTIVLTMFCVSTKSKIPATAAPMTTISRGKPDFILVVMVRIHITKAITAPKMLRSKFSNAHVAGACTSGTASS